MASRYWIKLYHEILDDPKMGRLPDRTWRRVIELFLLAGDCDGDGELPPVGDIAWRLRCDPDELAEDLALLAGVDIVAEDETGWYVVHFSERQAPVSSTERSRQFRKRQRVEQFEGQEQDGDDTENECNDTATNRPTDIDTDIDQDTEEDQRAADAGADAPEHPTDWPGWHSYVEHSKNRAASLMAMFTALYPDSDPPSFAYIGRVANNVGGAGRLAELMWQNCTRPPTGDVLRYLQGVHKNNGRAGPGKRTIVDENLEMLEAWVQEG